MQSDYGAVYSRLYREHWWWRAREQILLDRLRGMGLVEGDGLEILDVGCGDALSFEALGRFGRVRGIEVDEQLLDPGGPHRARISTRPLGDPSYDDPSWRFDLITALDVLEHLDDDRASASAMAGMLKPGGLLVVTVPAFELLWDEHDEINHHRRRYSAGRLRGVLQDSGLEQIRVGYLFRGLFAPKLAVRLLNSGRGRDRKVPQHGIPRPSVNTAMQRLCRLEDRLLRLLPLPFGTSVLGSARAPSVGLEGEGRRAVS
ncbi:class I SAM-dependent DNA methyltransferase [Tautonia plasticadhaerens]|uniref:Putative S-adenosylmethionine-dependent methyltransferase/MSMEI_2290 n=1 Tax=Tautonia plasticadhaerens TaxID=2527974 RepID=A0A518HDN4_9BACT|nr:class I SAM-dependent methyltransferase [Tautonia plasticadhaerens]QDV38972.1 putative S-adenosylmethionine-dependent methyltransferase/MSMEI_2290 [Tautonia plasticadhaerens]